MGKAPRTRQEYADDKNTMEVTIWKEGRILWRATARRKSGGDYFSCTRLSQKSARARVDRFITDLVKEEYKEKMKKLQKENVLLSEIELPVDKPNPTLLRRLLNAR